MNKLNFLGIGPKIAIVLLPWVGLSIAAGYYFDHSFSYTQHNSKLLLYAGIILIAVGLLFYFSTVRLLLKGLKETKLMTTGAYSLCQNPLYSSILLIIIPALSLILNSWIILTSSIVGYIFFKIFISNEYKELEKFFGEQYREYKKNTPEFFPFPLKKWFKK